MGNLRLYGSTSGYVEIAPPAVGGSQILTLPTDSVQPGMVLVNKTDFSVVSSLSLNNVFTSTYENYRILFSTTYLSVASSDIGFRLRSAGVDNSASIYTRRRFYTSGGALTGTGTASTSWPISYNGSSYPDLQASATDLFFPQASKKTLAMSNTMYADNAGNSYLESMVLFHDAVASFDGMTLFPTTAANFSGTIRIYGYRN